MYPFKVQLFQGCKGETEPNNTKSATCYMIPIIVGGILQSRYQVLLVAQDSAVTDVNCVYNEIYE
jgi:hypothetical protein